LVGEPATAAVITASIPVLIQLARRALKTAEREGAPANPQTASDNAPAEPRRPSDETPAAEEETPAAEEED